MKWNPEERDALNEEQRSPTHPHLLTADAERRKKERSVVCLMKGVFLEKKQGGELDYLAENVIEFGRSWRNNFAADWFSVDLYLCFDAALNVPCGTFQKFWERSFV